MREDLINYVYFSPKMFSEIDSDIELNKIIDVQVLYVATNIEGVRGCRQLMLKYDWLKRLRGGDQLWLKPDLLIAKARGNLSRQQN